MNLPNKLTMLRIILIPVFLIFLIGGVCPEPYGRIIALIIFIVASLTDMLDGKIARARGLITNFGKFMDPLADKLLVSAALIAFVQLNLIPAWVVIAIISREFIITGFRLIAVENGIVLAAGWWGKVKTTVQMIMIAVILIWPAGPVYNILGRLLILLAIIFTAVSGIEYISKNRGIINDM
ncbi:MAG: CDP-diacylglycerol--glycerol-3-phosphate 3-phosphatidyltransferase [Firmicutes bacterium]|nr:CDP-diacylglycerol--glycerol-3-phosphate 3-phosphatidyltransferase [Bacillota bacterium]